MNKPLRIVFMGTPDFAVGTLKTLLDAGKQIVGVITAPDKPAGRGRKLKASAVKRFSLEHGLPVLQPVNLKSPEFLSELKALKADVQIVVAFRMLPKQVWAMPPLGTFNLHASLLPDYRGAAPINWAIINGEKTTGVTTFFLDEKIDTGAIILQEAVPIAETDDAGTLHDKLMIAGSALVLKTIELIESGEVKTIPQTKAVFKTAPKLHKENTRINWALPLDEVINLIRGLSPYPAAWTLLSDGEKETELKIYKAVTVNKEHQLHPGAIVASKKELLVAVLNGFVQIEVLKLSGKKKMDVKSFLNGYRITETTKMR